MQPRQSEWQLVFFTIFTQISVGTFTLWSVTAISIPTPNPMIGGNFPLVVLSVVLVALVLGTLSAGLHLGQPRQAIFSITNLKSSWLSREAIFGGIFGLNGFILLVFRIFFPEGSPRDKIQILLGILVGLLLVYTISRLYMLRTVPAWNNFGTPLTFFATTFLLGSVILLIILVVWTMIGPVSIFEIGSGEIIIISKFSLFILALLQLTIFGYQVFSLNRQGGSAAQSVQALWTNLRGLLIARLLTLVAGVGLLILIVSPQSIPFLFFTSLGLIILSEILGRFLFYGFYRREGF
jgi:anaerobic dimethyl sulfoxide reductase subunit C